ncbi:class I SAM-dependent methyltransferase [Streptomyces sp. NPDC001480]|uniref:class I SAM-dependent methyltransferase n=1 Tax=Streptomyces sp. NPDC001480 TaxID=3364577 RepID=UPI0036CB300A
MPTLPISGNEPHRHRQVAESFGSDAERYDRTRPSYPDALVEAVVAATPGPDLLDVGTGTGIAARQFRAAGCRVLGVEVDARMAERARQHGIEVEVAAFEAWDPAGRAYDAVVSGQAWHWIDPVAGAVKAAGALRPGGRLAVFWNVIQFPPGLAEAVAEVCQRVMPDAPFDFRAMTKGALDASQALLGKTADGIRGTGGFGAPEQWRFDWERTYSRDAWLDQMPTQGAFTRLPPDKLAEVLDGVGTTIDAMGGSFTMPYATVAVTAARTGAQGRHSARSGPVRCRPGRRPAPG